MSENRLLPCPFCGGEAEVVKAHHTFPLPYAVVCKTDGCNASVGNFKATLKEAIQVWNTRKPIDNIVEKLEELHEHYINRDGIVGGNIGALAIKNAIEIVKECGTDECV